MAGGGGARGSDRAGAAGTGAARSPTTTTAIQSTIQSIKEVVGGHSDADILDTLRESNMDPNETAQKLLNQDPFHEVKRKRDKKKESAGQKNLADSAAQGEQSSQWMKPHTQRIEIDQRKAPNQGQMSGPSREFRVVRDNRFQHGVVENRSELGHKGSPNLQTSERSAAVVQSGRNRAPAITSDGQISHQNVKHNPHSDTLHGKRDVQGTTQKHANPYLKNSQNEHHFPGSGPAHVPANARTSGGTVGPARRQVGVINSTRQPAVHSGSQMHTPSGSSHANYQRGSFTPVGASGRHSSFVSRNIQQNQRSDTMFRGRPAGRSFGNQNITRYHQGPTNQKAVQPIKEWKPKSTKKSPTTDAENSIDDAISPSASNTENANAPDENGLSDKLSHANLHEVEHVIIPEHLRVPEYEQTKLRFGSFTSGFDSELLPASISADSEQPEHVQDPAQQVSEDDSLGAELDDMDEQARSSQHLSTSAEISLPPSEDSDRMSGQVENDDGLGLVQSDTPIGATDGESAQITSTLTAFSTYGHEDPNMHSNNEAQLYGLVEPNVHPQVLASSSQQGYPSENPEADNAVQVFRMPESNVHSQVLPSTSELKPDRGSQLCSALHSAGLWLSKTSLCLLSRKKKTNFNIFCVVTYAVTLQALNPQIVSNSPVPISSQQQHMSQQQAATQMYPPMHVQHFPNFMPYRQIYSPVYQMPMANYSPNVPYPSNGNNYLQMPGGGSHLTAGGMKYGVSPYKPVPGGNPSGYGNYTHPAGFAIGSPGVIGAAVGVDDVNRMKYKDNNIYASTPQVETSDIWIQTAREIPTLQVPPYYNMSGQATPGAFVPNPANASFNATAQSSHAQFPGLYHPQQPPSIVSPHPMVHQQVPSAIGPNLGVGVAAPGPQVGGYQQPQLGHMNWRPSF
ncbi:hypothetical protein U9M48_029362 [Paspalum notatum var. saurae]|uniref:GBF-interacting protein 1 N-terminal domain-containing protein n=1 Tax=Paspalum notatum var. saurae TaxID=547442 RepID=A0AAQ3TYS0_PASNO